MSCSKGIFPSFAVRFTAITDCNGLCSIRRSSTTDSHSTCCKRTSPVTYSNARCFCYMRSKTYRYCTTSTSPSTRLCTYNRITCCPRSCIITYCCSKWIISSCCSTYCRRVSPTCSRNITNGSCTYFIGFCNWTYRCCRTLLTCCFRLVTYSYGLSEIRTSFWTNGYRFFIITFCISTDSNRTRTRLECHATMVT